MNESQINESVSDAKLVSWKIDDTLSMVLHFAHSSHCSLLILLVGWGGGRMQ